MPLNRKDGGLEKRGRKEKTERKKVEIKEKKEKRKTNAKAIDR
jgi:hypothetical protein